MTFELSFIVELLLVAQLSFTAWLSSMTIEYADFPAFGRDFQKTSLFLFDDLSSILELPFIIELPLIAQLTFTIEFFFHEESA